MKYTCKTSFIRLAGLILSLFSAVTFAQEENIVLDPQSENYIITYNGDDGEGNVVARQVIFIPATKIKPEIKSKTNTLNNDLIRYHYTVKNGKKSKQALVGMRMIASHADPQSLVIPDGWAGSIIKNYGSNGNIIGWFYRTGGDSKAGLNQDNEQDGFQFTSRDLPGIGSVRHWGATPSQGFPDAGPQSDIRDQFMEMKENDYVLRYAAIPVIKLPNPYDTILVVQGIKEHVSALVDEQLLEPTTGVQINNILQALIDDAKLQKWDAVKEHIKDAHKVLKSSYLEKDNNRANSGSKTQHGKDATNKLIAEVLDFDLKYVKKRLKESQKAK